MMEVSVQWSWPNAFWSLSLFTVALIVIWYKMHLLRMEIHQLVTCIPQIGSQFVRDELKGMQEDLDRTRARVAILEESAGLNGMDYAEGV